MRRWLCRVLALSAAVTVALALAAGARAGTITVSACSAYGDPGDGFLSQATGNFGATDYCMHGGAFRIANNRPTVNGAYAQWIIYAPAGVQIAHALTPQKAVLVDPNLRADGYRAQFTWAGGARSISPAGSCCGGMDYGTQIDQAIGPSTYFAFQVRCVSRSGCDATSAQILDVKGIQLVASDSSPPGLVASGKNSIWYQAGRWIRGSDWPASFQAQDGVGVCDMAEALGASVVQGPDDAHPYLGSFTQCPTPETLYNTVDSTQYPNGPLQITLYARDAAGNVSEPQTTVQVDNTPVALGLSGPTNAPSSAGTQYVSASASAGPSGVAIACSLDGGPYQWHPGGTWQVPVSGVGTHMLVCFAQNGAVDPAGQPARSAFERWSLKIGLPTVMGIGFARMVDRLRCHRVRERVRIPARWVRIKTAHGRIRVHERAHWQRVEITRCRERLARRRIAVWRTVERDGHKRQVKRYRTITVALAPHLVYSLSRRVRHGQAATIHGWLGTTGGRALAGQTVSVLTAPDNGFGRFRLAALARTAPDGGWSAHLRPGPSRLIEAFYAGGPSTEGALSAQARLIVPAKIRLISVLPRRVAWGGTVRIVGQLVGGYLPAGGALVRLRIGYGRSYTTYGVQEHVSGNGRFTASYTFGVGAPGVYRTYWFEIASLPMGDMPWAPSRSRKLWVLVGGHPSIPRPRDHHRRHRARHRRRAHDRRRRR
jgi:hypothetical protein